MTQTCGGCVCGTNDQDAGGASPEGPGISPSRSGMPRAKGRGCPRSSRTSPRRGRGYPRAAGDIPNAARDVPGGRGYHRRGVGDIMVAGISPTFFGNVPARPRISPGGPGMPPGTGSRKANGVITNIKRTYNFRFPNQCHLNFSQFHLNLAHSYSLTSARTPSPPNFTQSRAVDVRAPARL